jgi:amidohydrolase
LTKAAAVITIGSLHGGIRRNIIPEEATMEGTIRTFDAAMQDQVHANIRRTAVRIAESAGATAEVTIDKLYPVTYNDVALTRQMAPSLERAVGKENAKVVAPVTMAEDFSFFQQKVPGFFFFVGAYPADMKLSAQPTHHTADFMIDERCLVIGVKSLLALTTDYMYTKTK